MSSIPATDWYNRDLNTLHQAFGTKDPLEKSLHQLFDDLNSENSKKIQKAERKVEDLTKKGIRLHTLLLHSYTTSLTFCSHNENDNLLKVIDKQSQSTHPLVRQRALHICTKLTSSQCYYARYDPAFPVAMKLAQKKMKDPDKTVQKEGLEYYTASINQYFPEIAIADFSSALSIAKELASSSPEESFAAKQFFEVLVKYGLAEEITAEKVALLKQTLLELCRGNHSASSIGKDVLYPLSKNRNCSLVGMLLEIARELSQSEDAETREVAFHIYWQLFRWHGTVALDRLLEDLKIASTQKKQGVCILLSIIQTLAGHDFSHMRLCSSVILQRATQDAPTLLLILTNLSKCDSPRIQEEAIKLKQVVEARIQSSAPEEPPS